MARAFEMGVCSRDDVLTWVGERALELDVLPDALLELTLLGRQDPSEIVRLLEQVEPAVSARQRAHDVLRMLADALDAERVTHPVAFSAIYGVRDDLCEEDQLELMRLDDDECWHRAADADAAVRAFLRSPRS